MFCTMKTLLLSAVLLAVPIAVGGAPRETPPLPACTATAMDTLTAARAPVRLSLLRRSPCSDAVPDGKRTVYGLVAAFRDSTLILERVGDSLDLRCSCIRRIEDLEALAAKGRSGRTRGMVIGFGGALAMGIAMATIEQPAAISSAQSDQLNGLLVLTFLVAGVWSAAVPSEAERELARLKTAKEEQVPSRFGVPDLDSHWPN